MAIPNLALIPTGYKAGKVYSVLPETGVGDFEFTRASAATRINSNGLLEVPQYSIGSDVVTNGNFATDSDWTLGTATISGGLLNLSGGGGLSYAFQNNSNLVIGKTYLATYTVVSISNAGTGVRIRVGNGGNGVYRTTTGTFSEVITCSGSLEIFIEGNSTSFAGSIDNVSVIEQAINDVPRLEYPLIDGVVNGCPSLLLENQATNLITYPISFGNSYWTKSGASIEGDASTAGSELIPNDIGRNFGTNVTTEGTPYTNFNATYNAVDLYPYSSPTDIGVSSNVLSITSNADGQGIKWNNSHIPTTSGNMYKFTMNVTSITGSWKLVFYDRGSGFWGDDIIFTTTGLKTLYVQAQSTNIEFSLLSDSAGSISVDASTIDNSVKEVQGYSSPSVDFPTSAFKLVEDTANTMKALKPATITVAASSSITASFYIKPNTVTKIMLRDDLVGGYVSFNLTTKTVISESGAATGTIETFSNGWTRVSLHETTQASGAYKISLYMLPDSYVSGDRVSYIGTGRDIEAFMAQSETGSYATSPTLTSLTAEGTTTTRVAEVCNGAGDASTFNDSEGVLMAEISAFDNDSTAKAITISASSTNELGFYYYQSRIDVYVLVNGVNEFYVIESLSDVTEKIKIGLKYKLNDFALWVNGFEVATSTSGNIPSGLNSLSFNQYTGGSPFYGKTKQIQYFNTVLTSAELETLTSWTSFISMANSQNFSII